MKTKLLKKIRKQYSVVYYPDGMLLGGKYLIYKGCYIVHKKWRSSWYVRAYICKEAAVDAVLREIRQKHSKYSRKYRKTNYRGVKVWYNS